MQKNSFTLEIFTVRLPDKMHTVKFGYSQLGSPDKICPPKLQFQINNNF